MTIEVTEQHEHGVLVCANHPDRETGLRCRQCGKPICASCAVRTPTGYKCKECIRGQQKVFDTAQTTDYFVAAGLGGVLALIGSFFASFLGFFIIFVAPIVGGLIAEVVRAAVRRRRSKRLFQITAVAVAFGSIVTLLPTLGILLFVLLDGAGGLAGLGGFGLSLLWRGLFAFIVTSTAYYRLSGIRLNV